MGLLCLTETLGVLTLHVGGHEIRNNTALLPTVYEMNLALRHIAHLTTAGAASASCSTPPQQQPNSMPWSRCGTSINSSCITGCNSGAVGLGYQATCIAQSEGKATWQYSGSCTLPSGEKFLPHPPHMNCNQRKVMFIKCRRQLVSVPSTWQTGNVRISAPVNCL